MNTLEEIFTYTTLKGFDTIDNNLCEADGTESVNDKYFVQYKKLFKNYEQAEIVYTKNYIDDKCTIALVRCDIYLRAFLKKRKRLFLKNVGVKELADWVE